MQSVAIRKIGVNGSRGRRIWIDGALPAKGGFVKGVEYTPQIDHARTALVLTISPTGERVVSGRVKNGREVPIIDISTRDLLAIFNALEAVRVVVEHNRITILPVASEVRAQRRLQRIRERIATGQPLALGAVASGLGIFDLAAERGLAKAGLGTRLAFANEIREDCVEHALQVNPAYRDDTIILNMPMQELAFDAGVMHRLPEVDGLISGIPCSAASGAGRARRGLKHPEAHPDVGHLVVAWLALLAKSNAAFGVLENVVQYRNTASADIIRSQLRDLGYDLYEVVLDSKDWNMLEHRKRWFLVFLTRGLQFDPATIEQPAPKTRHLAEILDDVPQDDPSWSSFDCLKRHQAKHAVLQAGKGSGFKMQVFSQFDTKVGTMTKGYSKVRSSDPKLAHSTNPDLARQFTPSEHARLKGADEALIAGTTKSFAHEMLGQSVIPPVVEALFKAIGLGLKSMGDALAPAFMKTTRVAA